MKMLDKISQEEKMILWHEGSRKFNLKAASDEKLQKCLDICTEKGYFKEVELISSELDNRKNSTDYSSLSSEERESLFRKKFPKTKDYFYCAPKTAKDHNIIRSTFEKIYTGEIESWRMKELLNNTKEFRPEDFGSCFSILVDGDTISMELEFDCPCFTELPLEMQVACLNTNWITD